MTASAAAALTLYLVYVKVDKCHNTMLRTYVSNRETTPVGRYNELTSIQRSPMHL